MEEDALSILCDPMIFVSPEKMDELKTEKRDSKGVLTSKFHPPKRTLPRRKNPLDERKNKNDPLDERLRSLLGEGQFPSPRGQDQKPTEEELRWKILGLENQGFTRSTLDLREASRFELELELYRMQFQQDEERREEMKRQFIDILANLTHDVKDQLKLLPKKGLIPDVLLPPNKNVQWARKYGSPDYAEFLRTHQEVETVARAYFEKNKLFKL